MMFIGLVVFFKLIWFDVVINISGDLIFFLIRI